MKFSILFNHTENSDSTVFILKTFVLLMIITFVLRLFILDIMQVTGDSMEPTLKSGQIVFINRLAYGIVFPFIDIYLIRWSYPKPDDIIIFKNPLNNKFTIKRCIAGENQSFTICNGMFSIEETSQSLFIGENTRLTGFTKVPENHTLVLGDNLEDSIDSRIFGFLSNNWIIGNVIGY